MSGIRADLATWKPERFQTRLSWYRMAPCWRCSQSRRGIDQRRNPVRPTRAKAAQISTAMRVRAEIIASDGH